MARTWATLREAGRAGLAIGAILALVDLWQVALRSPASLTGWGALFLVGLYLWTAFLGAALVVIGLVLRHGGAPADTAARARAVLLAAGSFLLAQGVVLRALSSRSPWRTWVVLALGAAAAAGIVPLTGLFRRLRLPRWAGGGVAALLVVGGVGAVRGFGLMPPGAEPVPAATPAGAGAGRPNVILVTVDTLRADHLSCYGYARRTSPAIDALASEGVLFAHALAQSSWTKPSTVSLLTSQYPTTHQTNLERSKVPPALTLLPEVLRAHGYTTAVFSGNPWVTPEYGFDQGVDHFHSVYDERFARETLFMPALKRVNNLVRAPAYNLVKRLVQSELSTTARDVDLVAQALRWLGESPPGPFFLYLHLMSPHHPYDPPPPFDRAFVTVPQDPPVTNYPRKSYFFGEQGEALADEKREDMVGRYDGDILFVDTVLGGFFAELRARGLLDRTVIVLTSDHGEEFFDHANWGHGHSVYDELLRVPLIVRHPALFPPGRVEGPVMSVDVMPTILELAGAAGTGPMAGRSLVAAMRGGEPAPGEAYAELLYRYGTGRALVRDHTKLVEITVEDRRRHELYDLGRDPREQRNLAAGTGAEPEFAGRLAEVTAWAERHRVDGAEAAITPEMEQRVRALGYVN